MAGKQKEECGTGCGATVKGDKNSRGHHIKRWADGGKTDPDVNGAEVCIDCHGLLHKKAP